MFIINEELRCIACHCNQKNCDKVLYSNKDEAWQMAGIVFGVCFEGRRHLRKSSCVIKEWFHFCPKHSIDIQLYVMGKILEEAKEAIYNNSEIKAPPELISSGKNYEDGKGCWITFTDVLGGCPPKNYQMPYDIFERVVNAFFSETGVKQGYLTDGRIINSLEHLDGKYWNFQI